MSDVTAPANGAAWHAPAKEVTCAAAHGGTRIYIPAKAGADHGLVRLLGIEDAAKLCAHFRVGHNSGYRILVPMGPASGWRVRRARAQALTADGMSATKVARALGMHERSVRRARSIDPDPRQASLFEAD